MKEKSAIKFSHRKKSSGTLIYILFLILIILGSISWIQQNTRPKNLAQESTPLLRCESPCTYHSQCPTGLFCYNGLCRNPQCKDATDCTCFIIPTQNPNVPKNTPRPTVTTTPKPTMTVTPTSPIVVIISPYPTVDTVASGTPIPVFEIDKESPQKKSILDLFFEIISAIFCRIFGC